VHRETERAPVHRQERALAEQGPGFERIFRAEVDVTPGRMERADLEHHQVEWAETLADRGVFGRESRVAAEEHRMPPRPDDHRRPQRGVPATQASTGEML